MADKSIGALWEKQGQNGTFFSGVIEINGVKHNLMVFHNDKKEDGDRLPDYRIFRARRDRD